MNLTKLSAVDHNRLDLLEATISRGLETFIDVGNALAEIKETKLYQTSHETFEAYCQEKWKITRQHAGRLIAAAEVAENVTPGLQSPTSEKQIRPLTALPPAKQKKVWKKAVKLHGQPTAAQVKALVPPGADVPVQQAKPQLDQMFTGEPNPKLAEAVGDVVYHDPVATALAQRLTKFNTWMERQENPYASAPPFTKAAVRTFVTKLLT